MTITPLWNDYTPRLLWSAFKPTVLRRIKQNKKTKTKVKENQTTVGRNAKKPHLMTISKKTKAKEKPNKTQIQYTFICGRFLFPHFLFFAFLLFFAGDLVTRIFEHVKNLRNKNRKNKNKQNNSEERALKSKKTHINYHINVCIGFVFYCFWFCFDFSFCFAFSFVLFWLTLHFSSFFLN